MNYYTIPQMIDMIDEPNRSRCHELYKYQRDRFPLTPGSSHNHQAWESGYFDHIAEVMNWAKAYFELHTSLRPLPFSLSDALLIMFLHDIEKPLKYELVRSGDSNKWSRADKEWERNKILVDFEITLTPEQKNAFKYVEGEIDDYSNDHRVMNELAAFCHLCDITSARIYHNYPNKDDKWSTANKAPSISPPSAYAKGNMEDHIWQLNEKEAK